MLQINVWQSEAHNSISRNKVPKDRINALNILQYNEIAGRRCISRITMFQSIIENIVDIYGNH
jgi:hypothetical protein